MNETQTSARHCTGSTPSRRARTTVTLATPATTTRRPWRPATLRAPVSTAKACSSVGRCVRCAMASGVPSAIALPLSMMTMRGHRRSTMSSRWEQKRMVRPCAARPRSSSLNTSIAFASRPLSGSSKMITSGACSSAAAISTFCRIPFENVTMRALRTLSSSNMREQFLDPRLHDLGIEAIEHRDEAEVLVGRERVIQRAGFGHVADAPLDVERMRRDVEARHLDLAALQRQEPGQDLDRGGLAGAIRPQQAEHFPDARLEREPLHRRGLAIGVVEVDDADHTESVPATSWRHRPSFDRICRPRGRQLQSPTESPDTATGRGCSVNAIETGGSFQRKIRR